MSAWIAVGLGGALGSIARHGVNRLVHQQWPALRFPLATVVVNVLGCCIIGILAGLVVSGRLPVRPYWREFVFVGVIGGFTTFSTFGLETITLLRTGETDASHLECRRSGDLRSGRSLRGPGHMRAIWQNGSIAFIASPWRRRRRIALCVKREDQGPRERTVIAGKYGQRRRSCTDPRVFGAGGVCP